ncbi:MAG: hypothetical protein QXZ11_00320 [Thermoproteota archaeon]
MSSTLIDGVEVMALEALEFMNNPTLFATRVISVAKQQGFTPQRVYASNLLRVLMGALVPPSVRPKKYPTPKQATLLMMNDAAFAALEAVLSHFGYCDYYYAFLILEACREAEWNPEMSPSYTIQKFKSAKSVPHLREGEQRA